MRKVANPLLIVIVAVLVIAGLGVGGASASLPPAANFTSNATTGPAPFTVQFNETTGANDLTYSEQLNNSVWTGTRFNITIDTDLAPDGTLTADKLVADYSTNTHNVQQLFTATNNTVYTFSIYSKASELFWIKVLMPTNSGLSPECFFDVGNGTVGPSAGPVTATSIESIGSGWYRIRMSVYEGSGAPGNTLVRIYPATSNTTTNFAGDNVGGVLLWGAQVEPEISETPYKKVVDTTIPFPTAWNWSFGDGATSTERDPVNIYSSTGLYNINFTATNPGGMSSKNVTAMINVTPAYVPLPVTDLSNTSTCNSINWTYTKQSPFDIISIYKNGAFVHNTTLSYEEWNPVWANTTNTISTHTCYGDICNSTWVNSTADIPVCAVKNWPKVMFIYDDGFPNIFDLAYPIHSKYGQTATIAVVTNRTYYTGLPLSFYWDSSGAYVDDDSITTQNMTTLYNAGWDVSNHCSDHKDLTSINSSEQIRLIGDGQTWLLNQNFTRSARFLIYPGGAYDSSVIASAKSVGVLAARTAWGEGTFITIPVVYPEIYYLPVTVAISNTTDPEYVKGVIFNGTANQTVDIMLHQISNYDPDILSWTPDKLDKLSMWIKDNGYSTTTISEWYSLDSPYVLMSQFTPWPGPFSLMWPQGILFTDASTGTPTSWDWNWGDGTHCYTQNCYKQWYSRGTYTVNLTVNSTLSDYSSNTTIVNVMKW